MVLALSDTPEQSALGNASRSPGIPRVTSNELRARSASQEGGPRFLTIVQDAVAE